MFFSLSLAVPPNKKTVTYFRWLELLISTRLKQLKSACLEKMFV